MRKAGGCLKVTFHIAYGLEVLFERVHYKMDGVKIAGMTERCVEQTRQQRIPQEIIDRVETFGSVRTPGADDWELVACEVRMDTGKFVTSTWVTEYAGEEYRLTIGPENMAERISMKDSEDEERAVKRGDFYNYVKAVNRGLMEDARPMKEIQDSRKNEAAYSTAPNITFTPTSKPVIPETVDERFASIGLLRDYRLEQVGHGAYRVQALPKPDRDIRGLRGAVLDALVDVYGMQGEFDIDIILEDSELMPEVPDRIRRIRRVDGCVHDTMSITKR